MRSVRACARARARPPRGVRDAYCGAKQQQQQQQQQQRTVTLVAVRVLGDDIEDACTLAARMCGHRVVVQRVATAN